MEKIMYAVVRKKPKTLVCNLDGMPFMFEDENRANNNITRDFEMVAKVIITIEE